MYNRQTAALAEPIKVNVNSRTIHATRRRSPIICHGVPILAWSRCLAASVIWIFVTLYLTAVTCKLVRSNRDGKTGDIPLRYAHSGRVYTARFHDGSNRRSAPFALLLIASDLSRKSKRQRQTVRETWLQLVSRVPAPFSIAYRFVVGKPSHSGHFEMDITAESRYFSDLLVVNVPDSNRNSADKILAAVLWSASQALVDPSMRYQFLIKTDQDRYIRLDTLLSELWNLWRYEPAHASGHWRGFVIKSINPISSEDKSTEGHYPLPTLPLYCTSALYTLSYDLVHFIANAKSLRRLATFQKEDQMIGIALEYSGVRPLHDVRIQQWNVCEPDMIAFSFMTSNRMIKVHAEIVSGGSPCAVPFFSTKLCPQCYNCNGLKQPSAHWICSSEGAARNYSHRGRIVLSTYGRGNLGYRLRVSRRVSVSTGLLTDYNSFATASDESETGPIFMNYTTSCPEYLDVKEIEKQMFFLVWTTPPHTFRLRQHRVLESIFMQHPKAKVCVYSNTLPCNFFVSLKSLGLDIAVVTFDIAEMVKNIPGSQWAAQMPAYSKGAHFYAHLSDFIRMACLYRFGGIYFDFDVILLNPVRVHNMVIAEHCDSRTHSFCMFMPEFGSRVGADGRLNQFYIPIGFIAFSPKSAIVGKVLELFDSEYDVDKWPCGTVFLTKSVYEYCEYFSCEELTILPPYAAYPVEWRDDGTLLSAQPNELKRISTNSIAFHVWNKVTSAQHLSSSSMLYQLYETYALLPL
jgi:Galactosyltransferase/Glycosyltransferase sugar-binding region containing DXD motif/Alpha 1,4-glycosyltransferase conserved region